MVNYVNLPPELLLNLEKIPPNELDKIIPTNYEQSNLNLKELTTQMVNNVIMLKEDGHEISEGLFELLPYWMFISDDERIMEFTEHPTHIRQVIWRMAYSEKDTLGLTSDFDSVGYDHPVLVELKDLLQKLIKSTGEVEEIANVYRKLLYDHTYVLNNLPDMLGTTLAFSLAFTVRPDLTFQLITDFLSLVKSLDLEYFEMNAKFVAANLQMFKANFDKSLLIMEEVEMFAKRNDFRFLEKVMNNKGIILFNTGRWDEAIGLFHDMLEKDPEDMNAINNLADSYSRKGEYEKAWKYGQIYMENGTKKFVLSYEFLQPIIFELELDEEAEKLMSIVTEIYELNKNKANEISLQLMQARQARYEHNLGLATSKINDALNTTLAWKNLAFIIQLIKEKIHIHIDLYELRPNANNKQRLMNAVNSFIQLCDEQHSTIGSIQGLRLRSQVYQIFNNIEDARKDLYNAAKLAKEFDYVRLYNELEQELEDIKEVNEISETASKSLFSKIKDKLRQIVGTPPSEKFERQDYVTHGVILMNKNGLPVFTSYITDKLQSDSALISGLISAISSMLNEVTKSEGFLKTIERNDLCLLFEPVSNHLLISIVSEDTFEARQRLQQFTMKTGKILSEFNIVELDGQVPHEFEKRMNTLMEKELFDQS